MKTIYVAMASPNKGIYYCCLRKDNLIIASDNKKIVKDKMIEKYEEMRKNKNSHIARKYFKICEFNGEVGKL